MRACEVELQLGRQNLQTHKGKSRWADDILSISVISWMAATLTISIVD